MKTIQDWCVLYVGGLSLGIDQPSGQQPLRNLSQSVVRLESKGGRFILAMNESPYAAYEEENTTTSSVVGRLHYATLQYRWKGKVCVSKCAKTRHDDEEQEEKTEILMRATQIASIIKNVPYARGEASLKAVRKEEKVLSFSPYVRRYVCAIAKLFLYFYIKKRERKESCLLLLLPLSPSWKEKKEDEMRKRRKKS